MDDLTQVPSDTMRAELERRQADLDARERQGARVEMTPEQAEAASNAAFNERLRRELRRQPRGGA